MTIPLEATRQADAQLMRRVAARQEFALQELMEATAGPVVGAVFKVIRNRSIADEVVQDVYLEAWKIAHRYRPELGSAQTWITVMAYRRAVDRVRREVRLTRHEAIFVSVPESLELQDPADLAIIAEGNEHLYEAMRDLSDAHRTVLVLAYFYGHTQREISVLLGVPLGTVKTRVRDGLKRLRRLI